jgi:uncharacterized OB-fold protein
VAQLISDHQFEQFLGEQRLMGSECSSCGSLFVPPRARCSKCQGTGMQWAEMSGKGRLAAFTCIAIGPPSMVEEGYDRNNPYCTGVIELEEGPRMVARIDGVDPQKPETIKIGTSLMMKYLDRVSDQGTVLAFSPA